MIDLDTIRTSIEQCRHKLHPLVGVFVGGTGAIGRAVLKRLFEVTDKPRVYIVGRNEENGSRLVQELRSINRGGRAFFVKKDVSLLKNVDEICKEVKAKEKKIHILFLTCGLLGLLGRTESPEGLDTSMTLNYYSRIRFIQHLLPLLDAAAAAEEVSRVCSVLAAGSEAEINLDDLDLRRKWSPRACLAHCTVMTDLAFEELGKTNHRVVFTHCFPGAVKSGLVNLMTGPIRLVAKVFYSIMTPWILDLKDSGDRHLFQLTSAAYPAPENAAGVPLVEGLEVMSGSNGVTGSGVYMLNWDGAGFPDSDILKKYRAEGVNKQIWDHTLYVLDCVSKGEKPKDESVRRKDSGTLAPSVKRKRQSEGDDGDGGGPFRKISVSSLLS